MLPRAWFDGAGNGGWWAMALLTCVDCGGRVSSRAPACPHCGCPTGEPPADVGGAAQVVRPPLASSLPRTSAPEPADGADRPRHALPLELITVAGMSSLVVDRPVTLGRSRANILVEHQDIAPTHCRLEPKEECWTVEDLSGLGIYEGASKVSLATLRAGEVVDVGGFPGAVSLTLPCSLGAPIPMRLLVPGRPDTRLVLQKLPMVVGRASWVDLPLEDRNVSHAHARLRLEAGRVVIDDLQSRNGTYVAGSRVKAGHALRLGDHIRLGETEIVFGEAPTAPEREPAAPADGASRADAPTTPCELPDVVIPAGLTFEQLSGPVDQHVHVPPPLHHATQILPAAHAGCPACGESFDLRRAGVITAAYRIARTAIGVVGKGRSQARVGRCSSCGARLALCPQCGAANSTPSLFEGISCRHCDEPFAAG